MRCVSRRCSAQPGRRRTFGVVMCHLTRVRGGCVCVVHTSYLTLFWERPVMRRLAISNLIAHRLRNRCAAHSCAALGAVLCTAYVRCAFPRSPQQDDGHVLTVDRLHRVPHDCCQHGGGRWCAATVHRGHQRASLTAVLLRDAQIRSAVFAARQEAGAVLWAESEYVGAPNTVCGSGSAAPYRCACVNRVRFVWLLPITRSRSKRWRQFCSCQSTRHTSLQRRGSRMDCLTSSRMRAGATRRR